MRTNTPNRIDIIKQIQSQYGNDPDRLAIPLAYCKALNDTSNKVINNVDNIPNKRVDCNSLS